MNSKFDQIFWIGSSLDPLSNEQYAPRTKVKIQLEIEFRIQGQIVNFDANVPLLKFVQTQPKLNLSIYRQDKTKFE